MVSNISASVAEPHHFDAYSEPACHFYADPDPACHFDADANTDPGPGFPMKAQNLDKVLKEAHI